MTKDALDEEKVLKALVIGADIGTEMTKQSALFAQVAFASARARNNVEQIKMNLSLLEADLDSVARKALLNQGEKVREAAVEALIKKDVQWISRHNALLEARLELGILEAATEAFRQRAMMLSGLGAMRRAEMEQEQTLLTKKVAGRATEILTRQFEKEKKR